VISPNPDLSGNGRAVHPATAIVNLLAVSCLVFVTSCAIPEGWKNGRRANINNKTKFSSKKYGVKSSPRIMTSKKVRKGGGRYQVGKPYKINGNWYYPKEQPGYIKTGMASWYGPNFHGRLTANGEIYDQNSLSAAHPTLPLPSYAKVTNLENGSSVIVRINDRGPFSRKRIIDLSARASQLLDYQKKGLTKVRVRYLGKARMDGRDNKYLMASYSPAKGKRIWPQLPTFGPGGSRPGTMIASAANPNAQKIVRQENPQPVQSAFISPQFSALDNDALGYVPIPAM
jgi:rare lipoprotein A